MKPFQTDRAAMTRPWGRGGPGYTVRGEGSGKGPRREGPRRTPDFPAGVPAGCVAAQRMYRKPGWGGQEKTPWGQGGSGVVRCGEERIRRNALALLSML